MLKEKASYDFMKTRENFLDYGKGLGIISIVLLHVGLPYVAYSVFLSMAFFFFSSGYTSKKSDIPFKEYALKKFKILMLPYYLLTLFYGLFELFRANYLEYSDCRVILVALLNMVYGSGELPYIPNISEYINSLLFIRAFPVLNRTETILPTTCHLWFLPALFCASLLFYIYINKIRKNKWNDLAAVVILIFLASLESVGYPQLPYGLGRGFWGCACMIVGCNARESNFFTTSTRKLLIFFISFILFLLSLHFKAYNASLIISAYGDNGVFSVLNTIIGGTSGSIIVCLIFKKLDEHLNGKDSIFLYIGRNTKPIYLWHMFFLNCYTMLLLKVTSTEPALSIYLDMILPETWYLPMIFIAFISIATIILIEKRKKKTPSI